MPFIKTVFEQYSIKTKEGTGEKVFFIPISEADNRSFIIPFSNIKNSNINFEQSEDNDEKFETVGYPVDIGGSPNKNYNSMSSSRDRNSVNNSLSPRNYNSNTLGVNHSSSGTQLKSNPTDITNDNRLRTHNNNPQTQPQMQGQM